MGRPVTLFTGQWADMPLENLARKAREFGYQGLELACWGDHFEVDKAIADAAISESSSSSIFNDGMTLRGIAFAAFM